MNFSSDNAAGVSPEIQLTRSRRASRDPSASRSPTTTRFRPASMRVT